MNQDKGYKKARNTIENSRYVEFILTQPCAVNGCKSRLIQPHNTTARFNMWRGTEWRAPRDFKKAIPLCALHHKQLHLWGYERFWNKYYHPFRLSSISVDDHISELIAELKYRYKFLDMDDLIGKRYLAQRNATAYFPRKKETKPIKERVVRWWDNLWWRRVIWAAKVHNYNHFRPEGPGRNAWTTEDRWHIERHLRDPWYVAIILALLTLSVEWPDMYRLEKI